MEPRFSLITLGVANVARARQFYEALGWKASSASQDDVAFFQLGPIALGLYGRSALAKTQTSTTARLAFRGSRSLRICRAKKLWINCGRKHLGLAPAS